MILIVFCYSLLGVSYRKAFKEAFYPNTMKNLKKALGIMMLRTITSLALIDSESLRKAIRDTPYKFESGEGDNPLSRAPKSIGRGMSYDSGSRSYSYGDSKPFFAGDYDLSLLGKTVLPSSDIYFHSFQQKKNVYFTGADFPPETIDFLKSRFVKKSDL